MTFEPIWDVIIACYLFLAGLGGGAFITSTFLRWRHPEAVNMIRIGRVIAPVVVMIGLVLLMFDATAGLQNPLRFALLLTNFGSVMTWGVVFLGAFMVVSLVVAALDLTRRRVPFPLDLAGAVLGLCVAVYTGCLLGVCKTFPLWNNAMLPILFLVSAVSTGMAAVLVVAIVKHPEEFNRVGVLKKFHFCLPIIELVLVASLLFVTANAASVAGWNSVMQLVAGDYVLAFWFLFVLVGLVGPTALETWLLFFSPREFEESRRAHWISFASDAGVLVGGFVLRLLVLVAALPVTMTVPWL
ncbi:NrfD/PsrC family molybdoenzyme membrane anchor subunit [Adlercreutzia sp. ZJ473]|uniref:NrfD/PsrC family molybdoenzyme membrane anchor subunit n=1 Tax=Adlercreutzia sp. ZJ473 TaxID=2722822 RepID=UPI0015570C89|nr:NrfD/PsrC family molybdoenzyme membrane anchor subunit [Adlercreutzia sp. ZJ473]